MSLQNVTTKAPDVLTVAIPNIIYPTEERPFTRFELLLSYRNETWTVLRRFSSFAELHSAASKIVGKANLPPFPKKKLGKADPAFLESRRLQLLSYMTNIVKVSLIFQSRALESFLMLNNHKSNLVEPQESKEKLYDTQATANNPSPYELFRKSGSNLNLEPETKVENLFTDNSSNGSSDEDYSAPSSFSSKNIMVSQSISAPVLRGSETTREQTNEQYSLKFPLHNVTILGDSGILEHILPSQMESINAVDSNDRTPLQLAALHSHFSIFRNLIQGKANISVVDKQKNTIAHFAARSKAAKILEFVLDSERIEINDINDNGETALHALAKHVPKSFDCELLRIMLKRGALVNVADDTGAFPLHYCAATGKHSWCKLLLQQDGANINAVDKNGESAVHYAARYAQNRVVKVLINEGADVMIKGEHGTPLDVLYARREAKLQARNSPPQNLF